MKNYLNVLLCLFFFYSCKSEHETTSNSGKLIDLTQTFNKKNKINLSEIATKIEYIPLATDSSILISDIKSPHKNVQFFKNYILLSDLSGQVYLFKKNGEFLNKIGGIGRGPDEYIKSNGFTVVKRNNSLVVVVYSAVLQKAKYYNFKGQYLEDLDVNFYPNDVTSIHNNLAFINNFGNREISKYHTFSLINKSGEVFKELLYKGVDEELEQKIDIPRLSHTINYKLNDTLHFWESSYNTIWQITDEYISIPKYIINIGENTLPLDVNIRKNIKDRKKYPKFDRIGLLYETSKSIFFNVLYRKRLHRVYYDKITEQSSCVEFKKPFATGIHFSFHNDIDGGIPFWPMGRVSDNKLFMITYEDDLKDYLEKKGNKFEAIDQVGRQNLVKLVEESKITDNPILMVVTLKNN